MSELTAAIAAALGVPETLVERSAAARAEAAGSTVEEVLTAWAGGGSVAATAAEAAPAQAPAEASATEVPPADAPAPVETAAVITPPTQVEPAAATLAPLPSEVTPAEAANLPEVVTVPTAGLRERTNFAIPRWLVGAMLIIPLFALFALGGSATGTCGERTELSVNVVTGQIVNCDGSEFTGGGAGGGETDYIAMGGRIYAGEEGAANCAGCHGVNGEGGVGPALNGVVTVFGSCTDHIEWILLGTTGFQAEGRSSYGDTDKPVGGGGVMPGFAALNEEQLAAVSAFERVRFGGEDPEASLSDCGLAADPAEEGEQGDSTEGDQGNEEGDSGTEEGAEASAGASS